MTDAEFVAWQLSSDRIRMALVEVVARIAGVETTLYLCSRPYTTAAAETPASTAYDPCVAGGVAFSESISETGEASISYGDMEIDNRGGTRDGWLDYVWANRSIQVYMGDPRWPRADFRLVFDGIVGDIDSKDAETLNLRLLDKLQRLNNPLSETTLGGTTNNKDRLLPITVGECFNVTPLLTDPATLEYQVHNGPIEDVIEVRDNGVPVAVTKSIATGKFTLSASPAGVITASVQGAKPATYSNNIAVLVALIVKGYGPTYTRFTDADLDLASLATFEAANTQPVGLYAADRTNVLAACQFLAGSIGAQVVMTTLGKLRLVQLALPAAGTPVAVTDEDMVARSLHVAARPAVQSTFKLAFCRNYTTQASGLAGGVPPSSAALFANEWRTVTSSDAAVAAIYKLDAEPPVEETALQVEAAATTEAARRRDLWKTPRQIYVADYYAHMLLTELGDAITITHDRFGLSAGKTGIVVQIERDWLAGRITLGVLA